MSELKPGWVDALASAVKTGDEALRSEALGVQPRRCFRINLEARRESARLGGIKGAASRRQKARLK